MFRGSLELGSSEEPSISRRASYVSREGVICEEIAGSFTCQMAQVISFLSSVNLQIWSSMGGASLSAGVVLMALGCNTI